jgi:hypothetical protein
MPDPSPNHAAAIAALAQLDPGERARIGRDLYAGGNGLPPLLDVFATALAAEEPPAEVPTTLSACIASGAAAANALAVVVESNG